MMQKQEVNHVSINYINRTTIQEKHLAIGERKMPVSTDEPAWIFEVGEETRVSRTTPKFVKTLVNILNWLNHLGSGRIDESNLKSRQNISHNFRIKGIGL